MRGVLIWSVLIAAPAIATVTGMLSGTPSLLRTLVTFWFLLVCPGMAYVRLLRLDSALIELTLGIALSIAIGTIVTLAQVVAGAWSVNISVAIMVVISGFGVVLQWLILARSPARTLPTIEGDA
jgi:uncharacterized membrane protein